MKVPSRNLPIEKERLENLVKIVVYLSACSVVLISCLGLISCGQIKQRGAAQLENRPKLLAKREEPRVLELDKASIYKVLLRPADSQSDVHCEFSEKAVLVFHSTFLTGVDYQMEACKLADEQSRELYFKMERKGVSLRFVLKTEYREDQEPGNQESDKHTKLYAYKAQFKYIDLGDEHSDFDPSDRNKIPDILHTKLSHMGKTLTEILTFDQIKDLEECFNSGRLLDMTTNKCLHEYSSGKSYQDLEVEEYDPDLPESERKQQLAKFLYRFHQVMLNPISKGRTSI